MSLLPLTATNFSAPSHHAAYASEEDASASSAAPKNNPPRSSPSRSAAAAAAAAAFARSPALPQAFDASPPAGAVTARHVTRSRCPVAI